MKQKTWLLAFALPVCLLHGRSQQCAKVDVNLSVAKKGEFARLIARSKPVQMAPRDIEIRTIMTSGTWTAVFAMPKGAERAVFFFQNVKGAELYRDTWGGVLGPDPESSLVDWTRTLDPTFPRPLADCFARAVATGS